MIGRFLAWIHHEPRAAWGDPYRTQASVEEDELEEEDIDAPPAVVRVGSGAIGPMDLPPVRFFWIRIILGVAGAIAIMLIVRR